MHLAILSDDGHEVGATPGLLHSLLLLAAPGIIHEACAFDSVIESFPNGLYPGYKTGAGVDPTLLAQFALGLVAWPMVEFEADDALASATPRFKHDALVEQIVLCICQGYRETVLKKGQTASLVCPRFGTFSYALICSSRSAPW